MPGLAGATMLHPGLCFPSESQVLTLAETETLAVWTRFLIIMREGWANPAWGTRLECGQMEWEWGGVTL